MKIKQTIIKKGSVKPAAQFASLRDEAAYWDTHSVVSDIDENTRIGYHSTHKTKSITIRFRQDQLDNLRHEADDRGIGPTTLARMWILEKMKENVHKK